MLKEASDILSTRKRYKNACFDACVSVFKTRVFWETDFFTTTGADATGAQYR